MYIFFFFNDTATTEIYTLSLHDALPISVLGDTVHGRELTAHGDVGGVADDRPAGLRLPGHRPGRHLREPVQDRRRRDRKSTRLNSSHANISYAVFCLKKKNITRRPYTLL